MRMQEINLRGSVELQWLTPNNWERRQRKRRRSSFLVIIIFSSTEIWRHYGKIVKFPQKLIIFTIGVTWPGVIIREKALDPVIQLYTCFSQHPSSPFHPELIFSWKIFLSIIKWTFFIGSFNTYEWRNYNE